MSKTKVEEFSEQVQILANTLGLCKAGKVLEVRLSWVKPTPVQVIITGRVPARKQKDGKFERSALPKPTKPSRKRSWRSKQYYRKSKSARVPVSKNTSAAPAQGTSFESLGVAKRTVNVLKKRFKCVEDLKGISRKDALKIDGLGTRAVEQVTEAAGKLGIKLNWKH